MGRHQESSNVPNISAIEAPAVVAAAMEPAVVTAAMAEVVAMLAFFRQL